MSVNNQSPMLQVQIWRGREEGEFVRYAVPGRERQTVLDVVTWVQRHKQPDLAYRFACRVGMCGSCAMTVNGRPCWTCRTQVADVAGDGELQIAPLRALPRIKDLVTDMAPFFDKWVRAGASFVGTQDRHQPVDRIDPAEPARQAADAAVECINCGVCYAACDVVAADPDYLGPAALNRAWTLHNDKRHRYRNTMLSSLTRSGGCISCHTHGSCTRHCPVGLDPSRSIAGLKRAATLAWWRGALT